MKPIRTLATLMCLAMLTHADFSVKDIDWGARLAYNGSTVICEGLNYGLGHGGEAGIIANFPIPNTSLEISLMLNGIYRQPYTKEIIDPNSVFITSKLTEYVGSIPIMLKYNISDFYVQAGLQIDAPLKIEQKTTKGVEETYEEVFWRSDRDLGIALGLGWNINKNISLDIKAVAGALEYRNDIGGYKLIQGSLGLSYFFLKSDGQKKEEAAPAPKSVAKEAEAPKEVEPAKEAEPAKKPTESTEAEEKLEEAANE